MGTTNPQRIDMALKWQGCDVISHMHCPTSLKKVAGLWCHQNPFGAQPDLFTFPGMLKLIQLTLIGMRPGIQTLDTRRTFVFELLRYVVRASLTTESIKMFFCTANKSANKSHRVQHRLANWTLVVSIQHRLPQSEHLNHLYCKNQSTHLGIRHLNLSLHTPSFYLACRAWIALGSSSKAQAISRARSTSSYYKVLFRPGCWKAQWARKLVTNEQARVGALRRLDLVS